MMGLKTHLFMNQQLIRQNKKNTKVLVMFLVGNQTEYIFLNLSLYIAFFT